MLAIIHLISGLLVTICIASPTKSHSWTSSVQEVPVESMQEVDHEPEYAMMEDTTTTDCPSLQEQQLEQFERSNGNEQIKDWRLAMKEELENLFKEMEEMKSYNAMMDHDLDLDDMFQPKIEYKRQRIVTKRPQRSKDMIQLERSCNDNLQSVQTPVQQIQQPEAIAKNVEIPAMQIKQNIDKPIMLLWPSKHYTDNSELDQQEQLIEEAPKTHLELSQQGNKQLLHRLDQFQGQQSQTSSKHLADISLVKSPSKANRVRQSLLNAADIAKNLASRGPNHSASVSRLQLKPALNLNNLQNSTNPAWFIETHGLDLTSDNSSEAADLKYLGPGQVQRISPFGNNRTQARLTCQFGDATSRNISIANVEWARFVGDYFLDEQNPSFECREESCLMASVKTGTTITVHPRPAIQNYTNVPIPSYSVTLHEVDDQHLGVYRCSALRTTDGRKELVYRIVKLD